MSSQSAVTSTIVTSSSGQHCNSTLVEQSSNNDLVSPASARRSKSKFPTIVKTDGTKALISNFVKSFKFFSSITVSGSSACVRPKTKIEDVKQTNRQTNLEIA